MANRVLDEALGPPVAERLQLVVVGDQRVGELQRLWVVRDVEERAEHPGIGPTPDQLTHLEEEPGEDAPVVVRVEIGAVEMKAREWAELGAGDVVTLGRKLGDPAVLRVAGVEVARGELVQVDGEYAVRILERSGR